jgi:hypothetical protein
VSSLRDEIATVDDLAEILGSAEAAEKLLADHGVRVTAGVFSRDVFRRAVLGAPTSSATTSHDEADVVGRGARVLDAALRKFKIEVVATARGKALTVSIVAPTEPRAFVGVDTGDVERLPLGPGPIDARVYVASGAPSGTPQFTASGFLTQKAPLVYFYVLLEPERVWVTTRNDLRALYADLGARPKRERSFAWVQYGFARNPQRAGTLRIWMPRGSRTGLDLSERIEGPDGRLIRSGTSP